MNQCSVPGRVLEHLVAIDLRIIDMKSTKNRTLEAVRRANRGRGGCSGRSSRGGSGG
jgi:hypothetical protein